MTSSKGGFLTGQFIQALWGQQGAETFRLLGSERWNCGNNSLEILLSLGNPEVPLKIRRVSIRMVTRDNGQTGASTEDG
ncbi:hypothetical protein [Amycolatopsis sp. NPDC051128]|uniref:hypothetical protein n=1 Tax=Amycolatopsis sp. NPDC051128 TaxID=3155412 RepID=UPI0034342307